MPSGPARTAVTVDPVATTAIGPTVMSTPTPLTGGRHLARRSSRRTRTSRRASAAWRHGTRTPPLIEQRSPWGYTYSGATWAALSSGQPSVRCRDREVVPALACAPTRRSAPLPVPSLARSTSISSQRSWPTSAIHRSLVDGVEAIAPRVAHPATPRSGACRRPVAYGLSAGIGTVDGRRVGSMRRIFPR